ncbi:MAG: hypothetical protein COV10_00175 [Candidatus Vogelbacteria bacterium CG10_big_fil_rev_8_21_14_0_10_51_16]|uniref:Uncharacterized protein n=1 Tax=Candidatus Vogelbacteria bacterium CG10_big_fil_rev_8_21_14_0_10_51_16 TaxID=1975045 RepID=A0A2H0RFH1_9BACT|nr:MAG: hypothetical protein COV10_00175 [Candidatus Vogelbacteria bacterium CG10_big_fil_rev_8_21_14_0_10_51_16]
MEVVVKKNGENNRRHNHGIKEHEDGATTETIGNQMLLRLPTKGQPSERKIDLGARGVSLLSVPFGLVFHLSDGTTWIRKKGVNLNELDKKLSDLRDKRVAVSGISQTLVVRMPLEK